MVISIVTLEGAGRTMKLKPQRWDHIWSRLRDQLVQLDKQFKRQLENQVLDQLRGQFWSQSGGKLYDRLWQLRNDET